MLELKQSDISRNGGILASLTVKSVEYLNDMYGKVSSIGESYDIKRHIVHIDPHLDEYFAEYIFRASLQLEDYNKDIFEEAIFSETNDSGAANLWPSSVVFGMGRNLNTCVQPLLLFDEHVTGKGRAFLSCSSLVSSFLKNTQDFSIPMELDTLIEEIDAIDSRGGAHPQHINNILKTFHQANYVLERKKIVSDSIIDTLPSNWKVAIINACFASILYALNNNIKMDDPDELKAVMEKYLNFYFEHNPHKQDTHYIDTRNHLKQSYLNQGVVINDAKYETVDSKIEKPQLLILSRICLACDKAWGENITNFIMIHFFEMLYLSQYGFLRALDTLKEDFLDNRSQYRQRRISDLGFIQRCISEKIQTKTKIGNRYKDTKHNIWLFEVRPAPNVSQIHRPVLYFINRYNNKCGIVLVHNVIDNTKVLFRSDQVSDSLWNDVVEYLMSVEPESWFDPSSDPKKPAPFIMNGNRTHRYKEPSNLNLNVLERIIKRILLN